MTATPTQPLDIGKLKELLAKAEPGTLKHEYLGGVSTILTDHGHPHGNPHQYAFGARGDWWGVGAPVQYEREHGGPKELRSDYVWFRHDMAALIVAAVNALPPLILMAERVERLEAAYRDLQRYIYDRTPERREKSIERHGMKLAARNALSPTEDKRG